MPFGLDFEAVTAAEHSSLEKVNVRCESCDQDDRITMNDGLGLVQAQIGDPGETFDLVAFGGDGVLKFKAGYQ